MLTFYKEIDDYNAYGFVEDLSNNLKSSDFLYPENVVCFWIEPFFSGNYYNKDIIICKSSRREKYLYWRGLNNELVYSVYLQTNQEQNDLTNK